MSIKVRISDYGQKFFGEKQFGEWMLAFAISFSLLGNLFLTANTANEYIEWAGGLLGCIIAIKFFVMKARVKMNRVKIGFHINTDITAIICVLLFTLNTVIYWIAFYPGNMFVDTYFQFTQIYGKFGYSDWHSFGHTLFMKMVMQVCGNVAMIVFVQMIAVLYIVYRIMKEAAKKGYNRKFLYLISVLLSVNLTYGLMIINIWKDSMYTICLLYLIFFLYRNADSNFRELQDMVIGLIGFLGVLYFRHNGFMVVSICLFIMIVLSHMKINVVVFAGAIISIYFLFTTCMFSVMAVEPNAKITEYLPLLHGIAAVEYQCGTDCLDGNTKEFMESLLPEDVWSAKYNPYNGDPLLFETDGVLQERCENISKTDVLGAYFRTFVRHPFLIIKDRLSSCELLWSVFPTSGSYNHIVGPGLDNSVFSNDTRLHEEFNVQERNPNAITGLLEKSFYLIHDHVFFNIIHFRPAWLFWVLGFTMLCIPLKKRRWVVIMPICLNALSLLIAMNFQAFRYVWFMFECVPFVLLLLYGEKIGREEQKCT